MYIDLHSCSMDVNDKWNCYTLVTGIVIHTMLMIKQKKPDTNICQIYLFNVCIWVNDVTIFCVPVI